MLEVFLQLSIDLCQLTGGSFQICGLSTLALGKNAREHARGTEERDLRNLPNDEIARSSPCMQVEWQIDKAREHCAPETSAPAKAQTGEDDRHVVQILEGV